MPEYSYKCPSGHEFKEFYRSFSEAEPFISEIPCPECGDLAKRHQPSEGKVPKGGHSSWTTWKD